MLLTVLILTGTLITATALSGILISRSLRESGNIANSMKAIYAADTGVEYELYKALRDPSAAAPTMNNGSTFTTTALSTTTIKSVGRAVNSVRAFEVNF